MRRETGEMDTGLGGHFLSFPKKEVRKYVPQKEKNVVQVHVGAEIRKKNGDERRKEKKW